MLFKLKDEKIVVIKVIRVCIFHAYPRTALQVEMLFKLDLRRWYQKVCLSLPQFRNMNQHFRTILRVHFKEQNHQWKAPKYKNVAVNWPHRGHLFTEQEQKQEGRELNTPSLGNLLSALLHLSKDCRNAISITLGITYNI